MAVGAALLAAEQTWEVTSRYHWPDWLFWLLMVIMLGACVLNTAVRMNSYDRIAEPDAQPADVVAGQPSDDLSHAADLVSLKPGSCPGTTPVRAAVRCARLEARISPAAGCAMPVLTEEVMS